MKCCKDCQWYFLDGRIKDEKGKHVCYGHYLICTPFIYVNSLSEDNQCDFFENRKRKRPDYQSPAYYGFWRG